ncbi:MAG: hypothetical protein EZS28_040108, partial [Streblomastix strix]
MKNNNPEEETRRSFGSNVESAAVTAQIRSIKLELEALRREKDDIEMRLSEQIRILESRLRDEKEIREEAENKLKQSEETTIKEKKEKNELKIQLQTEKEQKKTILEREAEQKKITFEREKEQEYDLLKKLGENLKKTLIGTKDDDGRKRVIKSGVIEGFNNVDEVSLLLAEKKPFPGLIRLLKHADILIVKRATDSIVNILNSVPDTTPHSDPHPHFETIQECDGVNKIFELFHRDDASKDNKDTAMICLGNIFRAQEITDEVMRHEIISHLKTLINDSDT